MASYVTGASKGSAISYPGGISAPDVQAFIGVVKANTTPQAFKKGLARAAVSGARKLKGSRSGSRSCPEVDRLVAAANGDYERIQEILSGSAMVRCCAKDLPEALCKAAFGKADATRKTVEAIPVVGQIYKATMGHLYKIGATKKAASRINAQRMLARNINTYVQDLMQWYQIRALVELGYPDLAVFLHDCRGVLSHGKHRTRMDLSPARHVITPYMRWYGSDNAKREFRIWMQSLTWNNRPARGSAGGARIYRGPGHPESPSGVSLSHSQELQRWLLNRHYGTGKIVDKDCASYPQDPTRGNRSGRCVIDYRDVNEPMGRDCLSYAGNGNLIYMMFMEQYSEHPDDFGDHFGVYKQLWRDKGTGAINTGKYARLIDQIANTKTIKDICKEGWGSAKYSGGSFFSTGSVSRSGMAPDECARNIAIPLATIQILMDYQDKGGVPDPVAARRWIDRHYAKELAFLRRVKMSETQKAGAYKIKKSSQKATRVPGVEKYVPAVKYDAMTGKRAAGTGPGAGAVLGIAAAAGVAWWFWRKKRG